MFWIPVISWDQFEKLTGPLETNRRRHPERAGYGVPNNGRVDPFWNEGDDDIVPVNAVFQILLVVEVANSSRFSQRYQLADGWLIL